METAYLIEFANDKIQERVIQAFLSVPETRCGFPHRRMLVTAKHLAVLEAGRIPYKKISDSQNGHTEEHHSGARRP